MSTQENFYPNSQAIKTFRKHGVTLRLWEVSYSRVHLRYELKHGRKVIFVDGDFRPSPSHAIDSLETVAALLTFLTLQPGDTDAEYFEKYTDAQRTWMNSDACENLKMWINDRETKGERK